MDRPLVQMDLAGEPVRPFIAHKCKEKVEHTFSGTHFEVKLDEETLLAWQEQAEQGTLENALSVLNMEMKAHRHLRVILPEAFPTERDAILREILSLDLPRRVR